MLIRAKVLVALLSLALFCTVVGCQPPPGRQITGTWRLAAGNAAFGLLQKANLQVTFAGDGKLTVSSQAPIVGDLTKKGTWKFISATDNVLNVAYQFEGEERPKVITVTVLDPNTIRLVPPLGPIKAEVPFERIAEQPSS